MTDQGSTDDDTDDVTDDASARTPAAPRATALDAWTRLQPGLALIAMIGTFLSMPQSFAVALIALVWVISTRLSRDRTFLGLTLTQALAWSATLVIAFLALAFLVYALVPSAR